MATIGQRQTTSQEDRYYGRAKQTMEYYHNNFRQTYNMMYEAGKTGRRPANMSIRQFLGVVEGFCEHLTAHHTIEERHIFPVLAKRMPAFRKELELLTQHKLIHEGIERLEDWHRDVKSSKRDLRLEELREILDTFGTVLWEHLDDEVAQLEPENMKKYWTVEEIQRLPM